MPPSGPRGAVVILSANSEGVDARDKVREQSENVCLFCLLKLKAPCVCQFSAATASLFLAFNNHCYVIIFAFSGFKLQTCFICSTLGNEERPRCVVLSALCALHHVMRKNLEMKTNSDQERWAKTLPENK